MTRPYYWFGRNPPQGTETAWGARAIYTAGTARNPPLIDLLPDRQGWRGEDKAARKALAAWVNAKALPAIKEACVGLVGSSAEAVSWTDGVRTIEASPNQSYGHLYLVAYDLPASTTTKAAFVAAADLNPNSLRAEDNL